MIPPSGPATQATRLAAIEADLVAAFAPTMIQVRDDSHHHAGHAGHGGGGHFHVTLVTQRFAGLSAVARHRLVYEALGALMSTDIHALGIDARAPEEPAPGGTGDPA